ncbi:MAG: hypothetical protein ACI9OJ_003543 [Myxococcota bacterium]|jgi:hypothetical protein
MNSRSLCLCVVLLASLLSGCRTTAPRFKAIRAAKVGNTATMMTELDRVESEELRTWAIDRSFLGAVEAGHTETVDGLLELSPDLDTTDGNGWTALMLATDAEEGELVKKLLELGADPQLTITAYRIKSGPEKQADGYTWTYDKVPNGRDALGLAVARNEQIALLSLLEAGANPNRVIVHDHVGLNFHMCFSFFGFGSGSGGKKLSMTISETEWYVIDGATVKSGRCPSFMRYTPLSLAVLLGREEMIPHLLAAGGDPQLEAEHMGSAITIARNLLAGSDDGSTVHYGGSSHDFSNLPGSVDVGKILDMLTD